ncbi:ATP-binding cassette domain-containing protein [Rhodococcus sp. OK302]|uniref:ATP-binding cassette domain-containing protein n=1 Tax=Rhodococcus sp. OK302 TaxID=1882769 RepID=UPI001595A442|nr:ATP-binding cassette domain-containing protein [Rhodococcus sp. OK302]
MTKHYGDILAVDDMSFTVREGRITGLLGRKDSGKSTILRMLIGLDHSTSGHAYIDGRPFRELERPPTKVGAVLDADWVYPHRSARTHLRCLARSGGLSVRRVDAVLEQVDLMFAADQHVQYFSGGMLQRLALAAALLGDPAVVILDEPFDDREPEDIVWVRGLLARLSGEGRTVFVSSRVAAEISVLAEDLVVIDRGRVVARCTTDEFVAQTGTAMLRVRSPQLWKLKEQLHAKGIVTNTDDDALLVAAAELVRNSNCYQRNRPSPQARWGTRAFVEHAHVDRGHHTMAAGPPAHTFAPQGVGGRVPGQRHLAEDTRKYPFVRDPPAHQRDSRTITWPRCFPRPGGVMELGRQSPGRSTKNSAE